MPKQQNIELLNNDIQDILGKVPPGIVRWGMTVLFASMIGLILGSMILDYPDVVVAPVTISLNPNHKSSFTEERRRNNAGIPSVTIEIPIRNSDKIKPGQVVHIKIDNYPSVEYGTFEGIIGQISKTPTYSRKMYYYIATVIVSTGLKANYHNSFEIMKGTGEVIVAKRSLFKQLFSGLNRGWR